MELALLMNAAEMLGFPFDHLLLFLLPAVDGITGLG